MHLKLFFTLSLCLSGSIAFSQNGTTYYSIDFSHAAEHLYKIELTFTPGHTGIADLSMAAWTPGYYQMLNFSDNISDIKARSGNEAAEIIQLSPHTFRIAVEKDIEVKVHYSVLANVNFIARPYIDSLRAFIRPTGVFLYPEKLTNRPFVVQFKNNPWASSASGLNKHKEGYIAENLDQLLDSPILVGNLEELESFEVKGIPHYFSGRDLGEFDRGKFMDDVEKIVNSAVELMDAIPYQHYHFIAIGKGNGGIEQTNSTAITFNGNALNDESGRQRLLNFITHEYFHHFNIKRIRPVELGPFNYQAPNRTTLLWVGEGLTVYYEGIIMNRAGLKSAEQLLEDWSGYINRYENNEGKDHQSLAEASYNTWEDGPFGIRGKTISVYEKGVLIGMLLDIQIRAASNNKHSLDDVMRFLYRNYYLEGNRGYTETEFKNACEHFAGRSLSDVFEYLYNKGSIDYNRFFEAAGLKVVSTQVNGNKFLNVEPVSDMTKKQQIIFNDLFRK